MAGAASRSSLEFLDGCPLFGFGILECIEYIGPVLFQGRDLVADFAVPRLCWSSALAGSAAPEFFHPKWRRTNSTSFCPVNRASRVLGHPPPIFALDLQGIHLFLEPQAESYLVNIVALIFPGFRGCPRLVQEDGGASASEMVYGASSLHRLAFSSVRF